MKKTHTHGLTRTHIQTPAHTYTHLHTRLLVGLQAAHNSHTNALRERHLSGNRKSSLGLAFCLCDFIASAPARKQSDMQQQWQWQKQLTACQKYQSITPGVGVAVGRRGGRGLYFISNVFFNSRCFLFV